MRRVSVGGVRRVSVGGVRRVGMEWCEEGEYGVV